MWHFAKWGLLRKALHICMSFQRTVKYSSFSLKSKVDKTVHVRKKFFGISLLLLLIFFQTWIYKKKNVLKYTYMFSMSQKLLILVQAGLIYIVILVVFQSCLPVKRFILQEYRRTYYFQRYNEPFPPKVMKTSLFWGRCRAPQTVVDLCALKRKLEILHLFHSINA